MIREIEHIQIIFKRAYAASDSVNNTIKNIEKNRFVGWTGVLASNFHSGVWRIEMIIKPRPRGEQLTRGVSSRPRVC